MLCGDVLSKAVVEDIIPVETVLGSISVEALSLGGVTEELRLKMSVLVVNPLTKDRSVAPEMVLRMILSDGEVCDCIVLVSSTKLDSAVEVIVDACGLVVVTIDVVEDSSPPVLVVRSVEEDTENRAIPVGVVDSEEVLSLV